MAGDIGFGDFVNWLQLIIKNGAKTGDNDMCVEILQDNPHLIPILNTTEGTLLHYCAKVNNEVVAQQLIEFGANVNSAEGVDGTTPLMVAVKEKSVRVVTLLLESNADINLNVHGVGTPLQMAFANNANTFHPFVVRQFIQHFFNAIAQQHAIVAVANSIINAGGSLVHAACWNDIRLLDEVRRRQGHRNVNAIGPGGRTAFYVALETNEMGLVEHLMNLGANVVIGTNEHGATTLHQVCRHGHLDLARLIINSGGDVNKRASYNISIPQ